MAERGTITPYHARHYAALLSRRDGDVERALPALFSARIDLHPHQVEAALFAMRAGTGSGEGVVLADEGGLGKTVEAGLALLQASLEGRQRLLVLCPTGLRGHWTRELADKFGLGAVNLGRAADEGAVVLLTYADAVRQAEALTAVAWDLCVLDEAHTVAGGEAEEGEAASSALRAALRGRRKLLLTAAPMRNSVMDLVPLLRWVDEHAFGGGTEVFREKFTGAVAKANRGELATRAQALCCRTLRRHALTFPSTQRIACTVMVRPAAAEVALSKAMSAFFHRERLAAFPRVKEHEIRLMFWKLLASSTRALAESLAKVAMRLDEMTAEEAGIPEADFNEERGLLHLLARQAEVIATPARATVFLDALRNAFERLAAVGAPCRAVVFSESRVTLAFLSGFLSDNGFAGRVATHPGGAGGKRALAAFADGRAEILLATDGVGTGLDLSACALVVNNDLPWNAQKLEQRISRCHRYGQKHDVLVLGCGCRGLPLGWTRRGRWRSGIGCIIRWRGGCWRIVWKGN